MVKALQEYVGYSDQVVVLLRLIEWVQVLAAPLVTLTEAIKLHEKICSLDEKTKAPRPRQKHTAIENSFVVMKESSKYNFDVFLGIFIDQDVSLKSAGLTLGHHYC